MLLTVPSEARCGTSCGIEQVKGRTKESGRSTFLLQTGHFQERARQDSNLRPSDS
jgi:hypothetical protein